jgi:hypothetical protein
LLNHSLTVQRLRSPEFWDELLFQEDGYGRWGRRKLAAYRQLMDGGEVGETVEEYAASRLTLGPPHRRLLNKADGRKKVVFTFAGAAGRACGDPCFCTVTGAGLAARSPEPPAQPAARIGTRTQLAARAVANG